MIINSLLDTDFYKLTMMQFVWFKHPKVKVEYKFQCRNSADFTPLKGVLQECIDELCSLNFTDDEIKYLRTLELFNDDFLKWLKSFKLKSQNVKWEISKKGELNINIKGKWLETILFETFLLSIVNELYFNFKYPLVKSKSISNINTYNKLKILKEYPNMKIIEFGTRRRYSRDIQDDVIDILKSNLLGTSNVYLARKYNLKPIGTMAHELLQAYQVLSKNLKDFQKNCLNDWIKTYDGKLGIALTDIINDDTFFKDFDGCLSRTYDGIRQDSGDPDTFALKAYGHYIYKGINPKTKKIIFSDGLTLDKAKTLYIKWSKYMDVSFGIGTSLTNDVGVEPLQIVIKMVKCNGKDVVKISNSESKSTMFNQKRINNIKGVFDVLR